MSAFRFFVSLLYEGVPAVRWVPSVQHFLEDRVGVVARASGSQRLLVVDPGIDNDPGTGVISEEQAEPLADLDPAPVPVRFAERIALSVDVGAGVARDHLEHRVPQCQEQLGVGVQGFGFIDRAGRSADDLAYLRDVSEYRNVLLVEQPNGDFAHTLMRQFLFDSWHHAVLSGLSGSGGGRMAPHCDILIDVPSSHTPHVQELHLPIYHYICERVEARVASK